MDLLLDDLGIFVRDEKEIGLHDIVIGQDDVGWREDQFAQSTWPDKLREQKMKVRRDLLMMKV